MSEGEGTLEFRILGPLEARRDGQVVALGAPKQRALLALLLLRAGEVVSTDRLIDELWGEAPPQRAAHTVQVFVSRLRKALGADALVTKAPGYLVRGEVDVARFRALIASARAQRDSGASEQALKGLHEALSLWRGAPLADFAYEAFAAPHTDRLEEERVAANEERLELELELGHHAQLVGELEQFCRSQPLRERPHALLMLALYRSGRQSEALEVYQRLRERLGEELGLEPAPELQKLERQILQQDTTLVATRPARRQLPEGTVTLLFTDIEGSTRLLQELGTDAYGAILAEHRQLLREACAAHAGVEVDTQGDALFVAFDRAQNALFAASAAQSSLAQSPVHIRIGVHTGEPLATEEGYVGIDVHRAARIMHAGHGGQTLVSETTQRLVEQEVELRDLGLHRLKDMTAPQRLYQLGDGDFPPVRSLNQTNLPVQPTPLVGRGPELAALEELLGRDGVRLVTLTGPGGTGKTRLALQAAAEAVDRMPDGVFWVSLVSISAPGIVPAALARALDVGEVPGEPLERTLHAFLSSRRLLLLLDNFEHVIEARLLVAELLAACPQLRFLVTSRERLGLASEHLYAVPPLRKDEAVELFVERARQGGVEIDAEHTVSAICDRLDRLPLAIELAAARAGLLEPQTLLERLERRLPLLKGGAADMPARQQTLDATIAWSHDLLNAEERTLFRRLSVFAGSFALESAEAVTGADLWTFDSLVAKSLVRRWGSGRFGLLETIREYAGEQLEHSRESEQFRNAHARHYLELALGLEPYLAAGERRSDATDQLAIEFDNLRAALLHFEDRGGGDELLQLSTALWRFWMARGYFGAGRRWLERGLEQTQDPPADMRARALEGLGVMCMMAGDLDEGVRSTEEALALFRSLRDARGAAESLNNIGSVALRSDLDHAEALLQEAADIARGAGEWQVVALAVGNLSAVAVERGDDDRAIELLEEETRIYVQIGDPGRLAMPLLTLGRMLVDQGRHEEAARPLASGLAEAVTLPQREFALMALVAVASMAGTDGDAVLGAQLLGAVDGYYDAVGGSWRSTVPADRVTHDRAIELTREGLGHRSFEAAYAAGRSLTFEEATAKALAALDQWLNSGHPTKTATRPESTPL